MPAQELQQPLQEQAPSEGRGTPVPELRATADIPDSNKTIVMLAALLAGGHSKTLRNMYCDGEPVGRMLIEALENRPAVTPVVGQDGAVDLGGEIVEMTDHLAKWGASMYEASRRYRICTQCGGFEAMVGMKHRLYRAQQSLLKRAASEASDKTTRETLLNLARDADAGLPLSHLQDEAARILDTLDGGRPRSTPEEIEKARQQAAERRASYEAAAVGLSSSTERGFLHEHVEAEFAQRAAAEAAELKRYRWVRQPSNLNCMMFEFKGNTPEQVDAYLDKQVRVIAAAHG